MIEKFTDLPLDNVKSNEEMDKVLQEHLGISLESMHQALSNSLATKAPELVNDMINMAPYGDYEKLTEDRAIMLKFLQEEAVKIENWKAQYIGVRKETDKLMEVVFFNKSVDDGDILRGFICLGLSGKIRHAFVQINDR